MPTLPESVLTRARWTTEDARAVLAALDRSGRSVRDFAEEHGLDPQRLYAWRRRVAEGDPITFHEVTVGPGPSASAQGAASGTFELVLASGIVVRVPAMFDAASLARLLDVLKQAGAC
jgi:transposase-like protein